MLFIQALGLSSVRADNDPSGTPIQGGVNAVGGQTRGGVKGGKRLRTGSKPEKSRNLIRGNCVIAASASNPISGPCVSTVLALNDEQGKEILRTRTDGKGAFVFEAEENGKYLIGVGSPSYEITSQQRVLKGGDRVEIVLQQK